MNRKPEQTLFRMMLLRTIGPSLILILAFLAFFCVLLSMMAGHNNKTYLQHQQERLAQSVADVEDDLLQIIYAQRELINSQAFQQFAYMYDDLKWYDRYELQNELQEELWAMRFAYGYIKSAWLSIPTLGKVISDTAANTALPVALDDLGERREDAFEKYRGILTNVVVRRDDEAELATCAVVLDEESIRSDLSYVCASDADWIEVRWKRADWAEETEGYASRTRRGERASAVATCRTLPIQVLYFSVGDGTDGFVQQVVWLFVLFVVLVLLGVTLSLVLWYRQIYMPLHRLLIDAFDRAEKSDLKYRISIQEDSPFFSVYDSYNHMMEKMEAYVENNLKQQILVSRANFKQLQSQINPHFMYNSYYVLYRLIKKGAQENAMKLAEHLGQFYHYVTRNADDEKRLGEEVEHARTYAAIQKFRFRDTLDVQIDTPDQEIARAYVPRLILQPVLENAFKYAYESGTGDKMRLCVHYRPHGQRCFDIIVENSGSVSDQTLEDIRARLQSTDSDIETTALVNIHRRLKIYFGEGSGLEVERSPLGGLLVCMHIEDDREVF